MTVLDVGCGDSPHGDVNVDLYLDPNIHRKESIRGKKIRNFVLADCHSLPFQDKSFDIVFSSHLLEHKGVNLAKALREWLRVSKTKLIIRVPNLFRRSKFDSYHDKIFTDYTVRLLFKKYNIKINHRDAEWERLYVPKKGLLIYLASVIHNRKIKKRIKNPLYYLPCPLHTEIEVIVHL